MDLPIKQEPVEDSQQGFTIENIKLEAPIKQETEIEAFAPEFASCNGTTVLSELPLIKSEPTDTQIEKCIPKSVTIKTLDEVCIASEENQTNEPSYDEETEAYLCPKCPYTNKGRAYTRNHIRRVHLAVSRPCDYPDCSYTYTHRYNYRAHIASKHDHKSTVFYCASCPYKSKVKRLLLVHINHNHQPPKAIYKCSYERCTYESRVRHNLNLHVKRIHLSGSNRSTHLRVKQDVHYTHDSATNVYKCMLCDYSCETMSKTRYHYKANHVDVPLYPCPHENCNFLTKVKRTLKYHQQCDHYELEALKDVEFRLDEVTGMYPCNHCNYGAFSLIVLRRHIKSKHEQPSLKLLRCSYEGCSYETVVKDNLFRHISYKHKRKKVGDGDGPAKPKRNRKLVAEKSNRGIVVTGADSGEGIKEIKYEKDGDAACRTHCDSQTYQSLDKDSVKREDELEQAVKSTKGLTYEEVAAASLDQTSGKNEPTSRLLETEYMKQQAYRAKLKHRMRMGSDYKVNETTGMFECLHCDLVARSRGIMHHHYYTSHVHDNQFRCSYPGCSYATKWRGSLNKHTRVHIGANRKRKWRRLRFGTDYNFDDASKTFWCMQCPHSTKCLNTLRDHVATAHPNDTSAASSAPPADTEGRYKCAACPYRTCRKAHLRVHCSAAHSLPTAYYGCTYPGCEYTNKWVDSVTAHIKRRHGEKQVFRCAYCDYVTDYKRNLKLHVPRKHVRTSVELCCGYEGCGYRAWNKDNYKVHVKLKHPRWRQGKADTWLPKGVQLVYPDPPSE